MRRVRLAREQAVDAAVVERLGAREAYLDSLVAMSRLALRSCADPAASFLRESHLRERVDLLLKGVAMTRARTLAHLAICALGLVLVTTWAVSAAPLRSAPSARSAELVPPARFVSVVPPLAQGERDADDPGEPKIVDNVRPVYPPDAWAEGVEGLFSLDIVIGTDGAVRDARVVLSAPTREPLEEIEEKRGTPQGNEGDPRLEQAALDAVRQWRFEPIIREGKPVEARMTAVVAFRIY